MKGLGKFSVRHLQKTGLVGPVWLTAIMTLVAGLPHFDCRCPDGNLKPRCLGFTSKSSGCCCGGKCCSLAGNDCCCGRKGDPSRPKAGGGVLCQEDQQTGSSRDARQQVQSNGCIRTVAGVEFFTRSQPKVSVGEYSTLSSALPLQAIYNFSSPTTNHGGKFREIHLLSPPTDLVVLLLHLLI